MNGSPSLARAMARGGGYAYKYADLAGGQRPWVLTKVANGLGKTTELQYSTSVAQMLAAQVAGQPWQAKMPTVAHMVTKVTEKDDLVIAGRATMGYKKQILIRGLPVGAPSLVVVAQRTKLEKDQVKGVLAPLRPAMQEAAKALAVQGVRALLR